MKSESSIKVVFVFAWAIGALFYAYDFLLRASMNALSNPLLHQMHLTASQLSWVGSLFYWFYVLVQIPAGVMVDNYGVKKVMMGTTFLVALGTLVFSVSHSAGLLMFSRALMGMGAGFAFICVLKLAGYYFPHRFFPLFAGFAQFFGYIGAAISGTPLSMVLQHVDWRVVYWVFAIFGFALCAATFIFVRPIHVAEHEKPESYQKILSELAKLTKNPQIILNGLYCTFMMGTTAVFSALWGIKYLTVVKHLSLVNAATASSVVFIGVAVSSPIWGTLATWLNSNKKPLIVAAGLGALNSIILLYIPTALIIVIFSSFLLGAFQSVHVLNFTIIRNLVDKKFLGTAIAYLNMFTVAGGAILQPIAGILIQFNHDAHHTASSYQASDYQVGLMIIPIVLVLSFVIALFFKDSMHYFDVKKRQKSIKHCHKT